MTIYEVRSMLAELAGLEKVQGGYVTQKGLSIDYNAWAPDENDAQLRSVIARWHQKTNNIGNNVVAVSPRQCGKSAIMRVPAMDKYDATIEGYAVKCDGSGGLKDYTRAVAFDLAIAFKIVMESASMEQLREKDSK